MLLGVVRGLTGSHRGANTPSISAERQALPSLLRRVGVDLRDASGPLRSRGTDRIALAPALLIPAIRRVRVEVGDASAVEAQGSVATAGAGAVTIALTPAGRALLGRGALAQPLTLRLSATASGPTGSATRRLTVAIRR